MCSETLRVVAVSLLITILAITKLNKSEHTLKNLKLSHLLQVTLQYIPRSQRLRYSTLLSITYLATLYLLLQSLDRILEALFQLIH